MPNPPPARPAAAPERPAANAVPNAAPAPRVQAPRQNPEELRRFFDAAMRDEEGGWNSDELPEADGFDEGEDSDANDDGDGRDPDMVVPPELMRRIDAREGLNRWNRRGI